MFDDIIAQYIRISVVHPIILLDVWPVVLNIFSIELSLIFGSAQFRFGESILYRYQYTDIKDDSNLGEFVTIFYFH